MSRFFKMPPYQYQYGLSEETTGYPNSMGNVVLEEYLLWPSRLPRQPGSVLPPVLWYHEIAAKTGQSLNSELRVDTDQEGVLAAELFFRQPSIPFGTPGSAIRLPKAVIFVNTNQDGWGFNGIEDVPQELLDDLYVNNIYIGSIFERPNQMLAEASDDGYVDVNGDFLFLYGLPRSGYEAIYYESNASTSPSDKYSITKSIDSSTFIGGEILFIIPPDELVGPNYYEHGAVLTSSPLLENEARFTIDATQSYSSIPVIAAMEADRDKANLAAARFSRIKCIRYVPVIENIGFETYREQALAYYRSALSPRLPDHWEIKEVDFITTNVLDNEFQNDVREFFGL